MFLPLEKALEQDDFIVGSKAKVLAHLEKQFSLPFSLVITSSVFQLFLDTNHLRERIDELLGQADSPEKLINSFSTIAQQFEQTSFPPEIVAKLRECFELITLDTSSLGSSPNEKNSDGILMLHRSTSYNDTDVTCPGTVYCKESFADFLRAVKSCMLSTYTPSSIIARRVNDVSSFSVAVIVAKMPPLQICLHSTLSFHKNNIVVQSYIGFPDRSGVVPKDTFTLSVDFLRIIDAKIVEQTVVAVFDKIANQVQHRKYVPGGSSQTVPDQTILEIARLTKKISAMNNHKGLTAEFIVSAQGKITFFDVILAPPLREEISEKQKNTKEQNEIPLTEKLPLLTENISGEQELASALISFLAKHKFSKFGPAIDVVIRGLKNEVNNATLKQAVMMIKEILEEMN